MRCDQVRGLNYWARAELEGGYVKVKDKVTRIFPDGVIEQFEEENIVSLVKIETSGKKYSGMFDNEYALMKYTFPDGRVWEEYEQAAPWSSGPVIFLALKDTKTGTIIKESLWSEAEIENA